MEPKRKTIGCLLALSLFFTVFPARSENKPAPRFSISFGAGMSLPLGYLTKNYGVGGNAGIEINFRFHKNIALFAMFHDTYYSWHPQIVDPYVYSYEYGEFACLGYFGGLKGSFPVSRRVTFYVSAGAGTCEQESGDYCTKERRPGLGGGYIESETWTYNVLREDYFFGLTGGFGLEYELSRRFALFAEIRVITVFNTERKPPPEWADLDPNVYKNPPNVVFLPIVIGISFKI